MKFWDPWSKQEKINSKSTLDSSDTPGMVNKLHLGSKFRVWVSMFFLILNHSFTQSFLTFRRSIIPLVLGECYLLVYVTELY